MKGLLPLLFIALILAACSNESTNNTTDSYTTTYQSSQQATPIQPPVNPKPQRGWAVDSITDIERRQALAEYFRKHNTTYCAVYKEIEDMEANSVRTAEKRYPDFADFEQTEKKLKYIDELDKAGKQKLKKKYAANDSIYRQVIVFGLSYCK